ncbi:DEAD/DEAH box helicase [Haloferax sulfurifontis]|uniref:DEAD/DEAH box helicase n=1 Tax=Haloferax sulfurifontis TaxID=255616 RepID=UPI00166CB521|nr:DEAD/DEAH box helicase family protein [Haloferax sulfurifontis]
MGRRFPPPIVGIERGPELVPKLVALAKEYDAELSIDEFTEICRQELKKPDGGQYSKQYFSRILSTYETLGVVREDDDVITLWEFARQLDPSDADEYATMLWRGIKQSWVLSANFPEGIEGLRRTQYVVTHADEPLTTEAIREQLTQQFGYEYNDSGIRGYPELLTQLKALKKTDGGYVAGPRASTFEGRWRDVDIFHRLERWIHHQGPTVEPPDDKVKRALMKYYMYRESGGLGKHKHFYKQFLEDYVRETSRESDVANPQIHLTDKYQDPEKAREELRKQVTSKFPDINGRELAGLYAETLKDILAADSAPEAREIKSSSSPGISRRDVQNWANSDRDAYNFDDEFELYDWQQGAIKAWFDDDSTPSERGIAQVVTGAGKTVMALGAVREWLQRHPDGVVTVVVPTKVLMRQWLEEFVTKLNVPPSDIGWVGDGHKDTHTDHRILVTIVNSAVKDDFLKQSIEATDTENHLLVADECHRYTGDVHSKVLNYPNSSSLGLSATPLSTVDPTDEELTEDDKRLIQNLGPLFYDLSYEEGVERGLISEFTIRYVGFDLSPASRHTYEQFSKKVSSAVQDIEARYGHRLPELNGTYPQKLQTIRQNSDRPTPAIADFFEYTKRRRELVAEALPRQAITLELLKRTIKKENKAIVFQERIKQLEEMVASHDSRMAKTQTGKYGSKDPAKVELYEQYEEERAQVNGDLEDFFVRGQYAPVMYHSGHQNPEWNDWGIDWFRDDGFANVMLSVQALKEGVDVPSADVGIIRVSSGNVRERIQTLGRILRTGHDPKAPSTLYVLYARDTVDENIFRDVDWESAIGGNHEYYTWDTEEGHVIKGELSEPSPDKKPEVTAYQPIQIPDVEDLARGDTYEGPRRGRSISVDSQGRPFKDTADGRKYITNTEIQDLADYVFDLRNGGGRIIINEADHLVTVTENGPVFLGELEVEKFDYAEEHTGTDGVPESFEDFVGSE